MSSPRHEAAIAYASAGIPVFPCRDTKEPATAHGFKDATTDIDQINGWWSQADYNPAFCPADVGWAIVDLDPGSAEDWENLQQTHGAVPTTYTVRTPRGGLHLYFRGELPSSASRLGRHIDTRGTGGYVLLPTSRTAEGVYRVEADIDLADLPRWISPLVRRVETNPERKLNKAEQPENVLDTPHAIERARQHVANALAQGNVAVEGSGGNARTYRMFADLGDLGVSRAMAIALVAPWNAACVPPWPEDELAILAKNAFQYRQTEEGSYAGDDMRMRRIASQVEADLTSAPRLARERFHWEDEDEQEAAEDPTWLVPEVLPDEQVVVLYGKTASFKSFVALDLALAISTGVETFGVAPLRSGPVFYAAAEARAALKKGRRRAWKEARGHAGKLDQFYVGPAPDLSVEGDAQAFGDAIARRCKGVRPALIVLDTLHRVMGSLNEDAAKDVGVLLRFAQSLVDQLRCTVLLVHHASDKVKERTDLRGSSSLRAGFDTVLMVERPSERGMMISVRATKHKDAETRQAPWLFEARKVGTSLALFQADPSRFREGAEISEGGVQRQVFATLDHLKVQAPAGIGTFVLANHMRPLQEGEDAETRQEAVDDLAKTLRRLAKTRLALFARKDGPDYRWAIPETHDSS